MPSIATSTSRRQRGSESEAHAPFNSSLPTNTDPFREDSTAYVTYSSGTGCVAASPSPPAEQSADHRPLPAQRALSCLSRHLASWMPSRESQPSPTTRRSSPAEATAAVTVPPLAMGSRPAAAPAAPPRHAVTPRGTTAAFTRSPTTSPRAGSAAVTPRSGSKASTAAAAAAAASGGGVRDVVASAPTVPLRRHTTPPPVIVGAPRGSSMASAASGTAPSDGCRRSSELNEPFPDGQPVVPPRLSQGPPAAAAAPGTTSPRVAKPPLVVGSYARASGRLSHSSSIRTLSGEGASRSLSSSTPCWVTDTSVSTPCSFEEEVVARSKSRSRATFFSAAPARGEYVALVDYLLARGGRQDMGLPSSSVSITSSNTTITPRTQYSQYMNEEYISRLCAAATETLAKEPGLLHLNVSLEDTLIVVGDIHGQFQDLYTSVLNQQYDRRCNPAGSDRRFLFMGDYVDRGPHSLEVVLLLLALKVEYPSLVYLTRGNHEEEKTSRVYGFLTEATSALGAAAGAAVWSAVNKVFLDLPLAAIVKTPNMRFFVTHGGLSPCLHSIDEIAAVNRNRYSAGDITADQDDMVTGLLWSDPTNDVPMYRRNPRGCGFMFGPTASYNFCVENNVDFICRAHQVAMEGYIWTHNDRVVTVFSAPNYCGVNGNKGAVLVVNGYTRRPVLKQYDSVEVADAAPVPRQNFPYSSLFV